MKDKIADLVTGVLPEAHVQRLQRHLSECEACRDYARALKEEDILLSKLFEENDNDMVRRQEVVLKAIEHSCQSRQTETLSIWRTIMKSRITKLAAAAVIIIAVLLSINIWDTTIPTASATVVLQNAVNAVSDLWSVHMKARMRTLPGDNFSNIGLDYDFVDIEMWKRTNENGLVQWRVEKPGRVLLMDGQSTIMLIRPNYGVLEDRPLPLGCLDSWSGLFLNVPGLLDNELQKAKDISDRAISLWREKVDGRDKIVLNVDITTGTPEDDYLRNAFIQDSDYLKVYRFDAQTKLLEDLQVYVHTPDADVLIFEVTEIEYNIKIDDSVFALELPEDMIWYKEPEILPDNEKYQQMGPREMAQAFFEACADENWDEILKFEPFSEVPQWLKDKYGGLEIISIGEPFKSGGSSGWFVPYEVRLKSGRTIKYNLAVRNDNRAKRYVEDGGL
jgi:hypothetical protein